MAQRWAPKGDSSTQVLNNQVSLNNLSGLEGYAAFFSSTGWIRGTGGTACGIIANGGSGSGAVIAMHIGGKSQAIILSTCSAGEALMDSVSSTLVASAADNNAITAIALQTCSATGQIIDVSLRYGDRY